jgi:hypothetical protein
LIDRNGDRVTPFWFYGFRTYTKKRRGEAEFYPVVYFEGYGEGVLNGNGAEVVPLRFDVVSGLSGVAVVAVSLNGNAPPSVALLRETSASALPAAGKLIKVEVDGNRLVLPDADPVIENGRTLVPLRYIFEALGAEVAWDEAAHTVTGTKDGTDIWLKIDDNTARVNGADVILEAPPILRGGRTLVPVRFIAESLGAEVEWNEATRTVSVETASH